SGRRQPPHECLGGRKSVFQHAHPAASRSTPLELSLELGSPATKTRAFKSVCKPSPVCRRVRGGDQVRRRRRAATASVAAPRPSSTRPDGSGTVAAGPKARKVGKFIPEAKVLTIPPGVIFWIVLVPRSASYRLPEVSKARPKGRLSPVVTKGV